MGNDEQLDKPNDKTSIYFRTYLLIFKNNSNENNDWK